MHRLPVFALILFLSTPWWTTVLRAVQKPAPPPTTNAGCEWDPWGKCIPI